MSVKKYVAPGNIWKGESVMETNWNKICEDPQGRIWFSGGDHWGTGRTDTPDRYERPWGFGNTIVAFYDPKSDTVTEAFDMDRESAIYSNAETPGHGKIHANILSDSKGNIWTAGYMGSSYDHEFANAYYPKSYAGGAIVKYDPRTRKTEYFRRSRSVRRHGGHVSRREAQHRARFLRGPRTVLEGQHRHPRRAATTRPTAASAPAR